MDLSKTIIEFLNSCAITNASFDPEFDEEEERFNGPDSAMFYCAAKLLEAGHKPCFVHSDWGSGCYKGSAEDKALHDKIKFEVNELSKK